LRAVKNGLTKIFPQPKLPLDVFNLHRGVVDEDTDSKSKAAQSHDVNGLAQCTKDQNRGEDGERDRDTNNKRAPPASQEHQDENRGKRSGDNALANHASERRTHEDRLIEKSSHDKLRRHSCRDFRKCRLHTRDNSECGSVARLLNAEQHAALPILTNNVLLHRVAIADMSDVMDINGGAVHTLDGHIVQLFNRDRRTVQANIVFGSANLRGARRQDDVLRIDCIHHIRGREPLCHKLLGIDIHHNLPNLTAIRYRDSSTWNRGKLRTDKVHSKIIELLFR
jgi:hypothetical protein